MIPRAREALNDLAGRIGMRVIPELGNPYTVADTGLISLLMTMLGTELESGVERRMTDGAELKKLFETATAAPGAEARAEFAASAPDSLSLTDVTAWLDQGLALLIELHAWAEDAAETDLDIRIWQFLAAHTDRHRFDL